MIVTRVMLMEELRDYIMQGEFVKASVIRRRIEKDFGKPLRDEEIAEINRWAEERGRLEQSGAIRGQDD